MVTTYLPKTDPLSKNRVKKYMKDLLSQGEKIEKKAEDTYTYFKKIVDEEKGSETDTSKKCMIDALKLQKEARQYSLKVFELCVKMFLAEGTTKKDKSGAPLPDSLEELLGNDD